MKFYLSNLFIYRKPLVDAIVRAVYKAIDLSNFLQRRLHRFKDKKWFKIFFSRLNFYIARLMVKGGYYKKAINEYEKIIEINPESRLHRLFFASFLIRIGHYEKAEKHFETALSKHKHVLALNTRMRLNYASLLCHNKNWKKAQEIYETLDKSDRQSLYRYMALVLELKHKDAHALIQKYKKIHKHTLATSNKIEKLIKKNAHSLCIVGNGAVCKGKKKGKRIDAQNLVIRFNNYNTDPEFQEDYGSKTSLWVRTPGDSKVRPKEIKGLEGIIYSAPSDIYYQCWSSWNSIQRYIKQDAHVSFVPSNVWFELIEKLGAPPSSGLAICYYIHQITGRLTPDMVHGFSTAVATEDKHSSSHYFEKSKPSIRHNWKKEREIMQGIFSSSTQ